MTDNYPIILTSEVFVFYGDELLLFKRAMDKKKFPGFYSLPGGHIEANEDPATTAARELWEETGIKVDKTQLQLSYIAMHRHIDRGEEYHVYAFVARLDTRPELTFDSKEGKPEWVALSRLEELDNVFPPVKYYFKHVLSGSKGVLLNRSEWKDSRLIAVLSETSPIV